MVPHGVVLQPVQVGCGLQAPPGDTMRQRKHEQGTQHRVGDRNGFELLDPILQQFADGIDLIEFVEGLAQQHCGHVRGAHIFAAKLLRLVQHLAEHRLGLQDLAFHQQAEPGQTASDQTADHRTTPQRAVGQYLPRPLVLASVHVEPAHHIATRGQQEIVRIRGYTLQFRQQDCRSTDVILHQGHAAPQHRDSVTLARPQRGGLLRKAPDCLRGRI